VNGLATDDTGLDPQPVVLVGGAGFVGTAVAADLLDLGYEVVVVDRNPPNPRVAARVEHLAVDLLSDPIDLPPGDVVVLAGTGDPRTRWPWTIPISIVAPAIRLAPHLRGRRVHLASSLEIYGSAPGPLTETTAGRLPWCDGQLSEWIGTLGEIDGAEPWELERWARELFGMGEGRWVYGAAKRAQELVLGDVTTWRWRMANTVGPGQERVVARWAHRAAAGRPLDVTAGARRSFLPAGHLATLIAEPPPPGTYIVGSPSMALDELARRVVEAIGSESEIRATPEPGDDSSGEVGATALDPLGLGVEPVERWLAEALKAILADDGPVAHPAIPVVVPPRPVQPRQVAARQAAVLWSGAVKHGQEWSRELEVRLGAVLRLPEDRRALATTSGTDALRIACGALVGPATRQPERGVAVLPAFTFPATAEVLLQLGYRLRYADVDDATWTLDPDSVAQCLAPGDVAVVVAVDTFGHPFDDEALIPLCRSAGVPLVADSAAALGSMVDGRPVGSQADAHAFSMSFAKVVSAGGAGGAVVVPRDLDLDALGWTRSALMNELHAVVALDQIEVLDDLVARRHRIAAIYDEACDRLGLGHQRVRAGCASAWVHYVARVPGGAAARDTVAARLATLGVGTKPYFVPLSDLGIPGEGPDRPVTERLGAEVLALPMSSELNDEQAELVCVALERALG
jgi:dTDP-4-amino-4,6-dideoxygalactose transaminase/nucleoside-diphosphate-sugar epimerase